MVLHLLSDILSAMYLTVDADQNLRQQEQRDRMVHLVDCKDELNIAMLKVILIFRRKGLRKCRC